MKKIILIALLALTVSCGTLVKVTAPIASETRQIELSTDKDVNFVNANEWMVESFTHADDVIQFSDKEAGIIKGKFTSYEGTAGVHVGYGMMKGALGYVKVIITVRVKDGAAKIEIQPTGNAVTNWNTYNGKYYDGLTKEQYNTIVANLIENFKTRMTVITNKF